MLQLVGLLDDLIGGAGRFEPAALDATLTAEGLRKAVDTRTVIGQAQGILMERYSISPQQAFAVLLRYSQDYNVKLYDLARRLVETDDLNLPASGVPVERQAAAR